MISASFLLEITKFIFSGDLSDGIRALSERLETARAAKALHTLSVEISRADQGAEHELIETIDAFLKKAEVERLRRNRITACAAELIQNALDHGCSRVEQKVVFVLGNDPHAIRLKIRQPERIPEEVRAGLASATPAQGAPISGLAMIRLNSDAVEVRGDHVIATFHKKTESFALSEPKIPAQGMAILRETAALDQAIDFIRVSGRIDHTNSDDFMHYAQQVGARDVAVDLSACEFITSAGLRSLLIMQRQLQAEGRAFAVFGARGMTAEVMRISRMDALMPVADTLEAALLLIDGLRAPD